jgi:hypothetical protein
LIDPLATVQTEFYPDESENAMALRLWWKTGERFLIHPGFHRNGYPKALRGLMMPTGEEVIFAIGGLFYKNDLMLYSPDPKANERALEEWLRTRIYRPDWPGYDSSAWPLSFPGLTPDNPPWAGDEDEDEDEDGDEDEDKGEDKGKAADGTYLTL